MTASLASRSLWQLASCEVFSLPGLNVGPAHCKIGPVAIAKLSLHDYVALEKNQYLDDIGAVFFHENGEIPCFAVFAEARASARMGSSEAAARTQERARQVRRCARACWLYDTGIVHDPLEHIQYLREGDTVLRRPNICGRELIGRYLDRSLREADIQCVDRIYSNLMAFDRYRNVVQLRLAEMMFGKTFRSTIRDPTYKYLLLLSCLTLLLGDNLSFLLEFAGCSDLKELDLERLIGSRNPIAHGSRPTEDVELAALESLVRTLLNHGIAWSLVSQELESFTGRELLDRLAGWEHAGQKPLCSLVDQIPAGHPGQKAAQKIDSEQELEYELSQAARAFDSAIELVEKVFVPKKYGKKLERNIQEKFGNPVGSRHFSDSYHLAEDGTRVRLREERIGSVPDYHSAAEKLRQAHSFIRQRRWVKAGKLTGECVAVMNEAAVLHQSEAHVWAQAEILFLAHRQRAEIFTEKKQNLDALQELEAAQQAFQKLLLQDAGDRAIQFSNFLCRYSLALSKESRFDDAVAKAQEAAGIIEKAPDPNATETRSARVGVLNCLAIRQNEAGLLNDALQTARESFALARELYVGDRSFRQDYYMALHTLSRRYERLDNHEKARFFMEAARRKELRYVTDD